MSAFDCPLVGDVAHRNRYPAAFMKGTAALRHRSPKVELSPATANSKAIWPRYGTVPRAQLTRRCSRQSRLQEGYRSMGRGKGTFQGARKRAGS